MSKFFKLLIVSMLALSLLLTVSCGSGSDAKDDSSVKDPIGDDDITDSPDGDEEDDKDSDKEDDKNPDKEDDKDSDKEDDKDSDKEDDKDSDKEDDKDSDKEDDKEHTKEPGGNDDDMNAGGNEENNGNNENDATPEGKLDFSKLSADDFFVRFTTYGDEDYVPVFSRAPVFLGMKTEGLFGADMLFEYCFKYGDTVYTYDGTSFYSNVNSTSDVVTNEMTFFIDKSTLCLSASEMGYDDRTAADVFSSLLWRNKFDYDYSAMEKFFEKVGFDSLRTEELIKEAAEADINLGTTADFGFEFTNRTTEIKTDIPYDVRLTFNGYIPLDTFDISEIYLDGEFYTDYENGYYDSYAVAFNLADFVDTLVAKGITVNERGILIDEAFATNFDMGVVITKEIECPDGTVAELTNKLYVNFKDEPIFYSLNIPEVIEAPIDFVNGMTYKFDLDINGLVFPMTYDGTDTAIRASKIVGDCLPEFLLTYGACERDGYADLTYKMPDEIVYVIDSLPVDNRAEKLLEYLQLGRFEFVYEDFTSVLDKDTTTIGLISFKEMIESLTTAESGVKLNWYLPTTTLEACEEYHEISARTDMKKKYDTVSVDVTAKLKLAPALRDIEASAKPIQLSYYVGDELVINEGATLTLIYKSAFGQDAPATTEVIPLTADMVLGFDTSKATDDVDRYYSIVYKGLVACNELYYVKVDKLISIDYDLGNFKYYVLDVAPDYTQFSLTLNYESGRVKENVPVKESYFVFETIPTTPGSHEITLKIEDCTVDVPIKVVKIATLEVVGGIDACYVLGSKPSEVILYATFEPNNFGIYEEYTTLTGYDIKNFNSYMIGENTWSVKVGGVTASIKYNVIEAAYIGYTVSEDGSYITINGLHLSRKEITTDYYQLSSIGAFTVPTEIKGIPVKKITDRAFADTNLFTKITIPESITEIGVYAFERIYSLKSVVFEGSRAVIPEGCFSGCEYLESVVFPSGLTTLDTYSFAYVGIKEFVIPKGVTTVGYGFLYNARVERLAVPSSATASFKALPAMNLLSLREFAYDGSYRLRESSALDDIIRNTLPSGLNKAYIYDTESFNRGISYTTYTAFEIFIDESVTSITNNNSTLTEYNGTKYYCAAAPSTIDNASGMPLTQKSFEQWYE